MQISTMRRLALGTSVIGTCALVAACKPAASSGPAGELTKSLMEQLHGGSFRGTPKLDVVKDARIERRNDAGESTGAYDGSRLLQAADSHALGTPEIIDAGDVKNDGTATFNEVRQVVRAYDRDQSGSIDTPAEQREFAAVDILWIPANRTAAGRTSV